MTTDQIAGLVCIAAGLLVPAVVIAWVVIIRWAVRAPWVEPYDDAWDQRDRATTWIEEWEQARTPEATAARMRARVGGEGR